MNEIKNINEYVSFETACSLKKIGFPQTDKDDNIEIKYWYCQNDKIDSNISNKSLCACPSIYEVQKWFRDYKNISIIINDFQLNIIDDYYISHILFLNRYRIFLNETEKTIKDFSSKWKSSLCLKYEDALKEAIDSLLQIILKQNNMEKKKLKK